MNKVNFGNVKINNTSSKELLNVIDKESNTNHNPISISFLNAHCFNVAQSDSHYRACLQSSDYLLNDGVGVDIAARIYGFKFKENLNGTDFIPKLLNQTNNKSGKVFLLGSTSKNVELAAHELKKRYKKLKSVNYHNGFFENNDLILSMINKDQPDILLVGMGVPLQEKWIQENKEKISCSLILGVGAYIDFESRTIARAPKFIRKLKLEWCFRLLQEPKRLYKRYLFGNLLFFYNVFKERKGDKE